jgi:hypothetical protein
MRAGHLDESEIAEQREMFGDLHGSFHRISLRVAALEPASRHRRLGVTERLKLGHF